MPELQSSDVKVEIGHVLFIDIVGYSRLLIDQQSDRLRKLKEIVQGTEQFRLAEAEGKLLRRPTGGRWRAGFPDQSRGAGSLCHGNESGTEKAS